MGQAQHKVTISPKTLWGHMVPENGLCEWQGQGGVTVSEDWKCQEGRSVVGMLACFIWFDTDMGSLILKTNFTWANFQTTGAGRTTRQSWHWLFLQRTRVQILEPTKWLTAVTSVLGIWPPFLASTGIGHACDIKTYMWGKHSSCT